MSAHAAIHEHQPPYDDTETHRFNRRMIRIQQIGQKVDDLGDRVEGHSSGIVYRCISAVRKAAKGRASE